MKIILRLLAPLLILIISACSSENILTEQERAIQSKADAEVAIILFDSDLTKLASYRVHKNGFVVISFDKKIKEQNYTNVVKILRANKSIFGVRAEQQGKEVCPLR